MTRPLTLGPGELDERQREWADNSETEAAPISLDPNEPPGIPAVSETFLIVRNGDRFSQLALHEGGEWIVGRGAEAHIVACDQRVSRRHTKLTFQAGVFAVEDLGSRNGIVVNGRSIRGTAVRIGTG